MRTATLAVAAAALIPLGVAATPASSAPDSHESAAHLKCTEASSKKARTRCRGRATRRKATQRIEGTRISYTQGSASALGPVSRESYDFCAAGRYAHLATTSAFGPPLYELGDSYDGTWAVKKAVVKPQQTTAWVALTRGNFSSTNIDGSPGGSTAPTPRITIRLRLLEHNLATVSSPETIPRLWTRTSGASC